MLKWLAVLAVLIPSIALADPVAVFSAGWITLTKEPCDLEVVLNAVPVEYKHKMLKAKIKYEGKDIKACWTIYNGQVQGADEYMNPFVFERSDFQEPVGI